MFQNYYYIIIKRITFSDDNEFDLCLFSLVNHNSVHKYIYILLFIVKIKLLGVSGNQNSKVEKGFRKFLIGNRDKNFRKTCLPY